MKLNFSKANVTDKTNILDINIPAAMRVRHKSNIEWLDDAFADGLVSTQVIMLTGDPGGGKTTLMLQWADSLTGAGHNVLYNSYEESLFQVALKIEQLGLKTGFVPSQHRKAPDLLAQADRMMKAAPKKHFILIQDSLPTLDDGFYKDGAMNSKTPERAVTMLNNWAKESGATVIFVNHVTKSGVFVGKNTVKHAIDTHAAIKVDKKTGYRNFNVEKSRFGATYNTYVIGLGQGGIKLVRKVSKIAADLDGDDVTAQSQSNSSTDDAMVIDMEHRRNGRGRRTRLG